MKKIIVFFILISISAQAQLGKSIFSKDPIINLENFDKQRLYWGYFLGFSTFDFKTDYKIPGQDINITGLIDTLKTNPNSRRMLVSAWNPSVLPDTSKSFADNVANEKAALPPCHAFFQFYVAEGKLSCQLYQRSADIFLGVPFNIASYALFTMMIAQVCGLQVGEFIHTFGDAHIYNNHFEQVELQLSRDPRPLPKMTLNPNVKNIFEFQFEDFTLVDYDPHPHIKGAVAI